MQTLSAFCVLFHQAAHHHATHIKQPPTAPRHLAPSWGAVRILLSRAYTGTAQGSSVRRLLASANRGFGERSQKAIALTINCLSSPVGLCQTRV
nr:MAG TPA_asm: hypothetical protein [Caudoviricetes sp.]